jgi:hypothetical protein
VDLANVDLVQIGAGIAVVLLGLYAVVAIRRNRS